MKPDPAIVLYWACVDLYRALGTTYGLHDSRSPELAESTWVDADWDEQVMLLEELDRAIANFFEQCDIDVDVDIAVSLPAREAHAAE